MRAMISANSKQEIKSLLSESACKNAGLVLMNISSEAIYLGAMNPVYSKVTEVVEELKSQYEIEVNLEQISPEIWEKWYDSEEASISFDNASHNLLPEDTVTAISNEEYPNNTYGSEESVISSELIEAENVEILKEEEKEQKGSEPEPEKQDVPLSKVSSKNDKSNDHSNIDTEGSDPSLIRKKSLLEEILQDDSLSDINDAKFDFFNEEEDEEDEDNIDILDDSELQDATDPVIKAAGSILATSARLKASDIHAEPLEDRMRIRYRIDGVLKEVYSLPKAKARAISSRLKVMSKLDIAERRLPQDGRIRCRIDDKVSDFRVSTLPGKWGEKIVLRALQSDSSMLDLEKLISEKSELDLIRQMGSSPYGILIVVGPTGSGKSTTLYSILNERNTPDVNISTVEDPVEYTLDGIHQVQVIREKGLDFARALRSLMRQDPDIILVGETRDRETAQTAMEAALTGHMVFTTLHANDTATAITRLAEMGIPPYLVGSSVIGVMAQRLIRKICPKCSTVRDVDQEKDQLAMEFGIKKLKKATVIDISDENIKEKDLCPVCNGTGYKGRLGLYEVMKVNDSIRELIMKSSTADVIRQKCKENGIRSLLDYGLHLVKKELTTIEEVQRVCLLND